tara:strand:+ start:2045 stop:2884 length:840 start_codon:yes stop_codon:yes gene_type:complete
VKNKKKGAVGIGLRAEHYQIMQQTKPAIDFLEVHSENYFEQNSLNYYYLQQLSQHYPLSFHGIGLSLGSAEDISLKHLKQLKTLVKEFQPFLISDHLSWSSWQGTYFNDLLPVPYTKEALLRFIKNINQVQDYLQTQIIIENPSTYLEFKKSDFHEADFLNQISQQTGCGLLLDINNVYVSATNNNFSAQQYLDTINFDKVQEIHLAGHTCKQFEHGEILIDTHSKLISEPVWQLYQANIQKIKSAVTLIEWDAELPDISVLLGERDKAKQLAAGFING